MHSSFNSLSLNSARDNGNESTINTGIPKRKNRNLELRYLRTNFLPSSWLFHLLLPSSWVPLQEPWQTPLCLSLVPVNDNYIHVIRTINHESI